MSFVGGKFLDHKKGIEGLPAILGGAPGDGPIKGFVPGKISHATPPNARTQIMLDTPMGKGSGIFFGFLWQMRKKGFVVDKVQEMIEISPVHSQYYQITIQQKQNLENQIKSSLAGIQTSISDYELLSHDLRRYREYMNYFEKIAEGKKNKDEKAVKEATQTLKSLYIDHVDVHTGEGVALKLIAPRWPTIIVDFMRITEEDTIPEEIAEKYGFSTSEGVVLATKNKIFKEWMNLFKQTVQSRYLHLTQLSEARKKSITEYRRMVRPYVLRHRMINEFGESPVGRGILKSFSWWRPSTQAVSMDMAEYWLWRPFTPPEFTRAPVQYYEEDLSLNRSYLPEIIKKEVKSNSHVLDKAKSKGYLKEDYTKKVPMFPTSIEPVDEWVWYLKDEVVDYYKKNFNYSAKLNIADVFKARENLANKFAEYTRWDWVPSPYFMTLEVETFRIVVRNPDGTEGEVFIVGSYPDHPMMGFLDTQNVMIVREMEKILQDKEMDYYVDDMVGETREGRALKEIIEEDEYPNMYNNEKTIEANKEDEKAREALKKRLMNNATFAASRPGPYDSVFMERVAAIMVKSIVQSAYGPAVGYFKSAAGA